MLFGTILDVLAFKTTIILMDYKIRAYPYKEIMVWMIGKADKFNKDRLKQCRGVHAEHADDDTFMLRSLSFWCLHW